MPFWPFKKRRKASGTLPVTEKAQIEQTSTRAVTYPPAGPTSPIDIPSTSSNPTSWRKRQAPPDASPEALRIDGEKQTLSPGKENVPPLAQERITSKEDITALPMTHKLEHSPHLRPVDMERPHIPYNFQQYSTSQTSVQREEGVGSPTRPQRLRKRRSEYDSSTPQRRRSSRRRKDDHVREEEIRAMSAQKPIPKRPGGHSEGPLRRDSKKMRGLGMKESNVSLPPEDSIHSTMSGILEQRGWEIGSMDVFSPRPAVRLSGVPQYATPSSLQESSPLSLQHKERLKEKAPVARDSKKKRETIGNRADDLDARDLRTLLERDAKRREKRKKEQQEKLDRKLRSRGGRNRGDSDKKRREAEELRRADEAKRRAEEERRARELTTAPDSVHPALRDEKPEAVGLGIGEGYVASGADETEEPAVSGEDEQPEDPFTDAAATERAETPASERLPPMPGAFSPVQTPMEDPVLETAKEVRLSQTATPPLSPVQSGRGISSLSQMVDTRRASDLPPPPAVPVDSRRSSDPKPERRTGAWATLFRRGGTNLRRDDGRATPSEASFSNASRESMRNQPLPAHLVDTQPQPRAMSSTPVRTQSKFREDLPEMPISPPDSRLPSPDVTAAATAAATARRGGRSPRPFDVPREAAVAESEVQAPGRSDTPISPSLRSPRLMSGSLASVDSEASWLASGSKRHSTQSGFRGSVGSLRQRRPEFSTSYEELGEDNDASYFSRGTPSPDSKRALHAHKLSASALVGASPDEESEYGETAGPETSGDPFTVHESIRRVPTLVHRDPRVKSREALAVYSAEVESPEPISAGSGKESLDSDPDGSEPEMARAVSVDYGKRHARQVSAGSAKLLEMPSRRISGDVKSDMQPTSSSKL